MKNKKKGITIYIIIMSVVAVIIYTAVYNITYATYSGALDRTPEEIQAVFTDNKDDFEYVAQTMQQWEEGSIYFSDPYGKHLDFDDILINGSGIETEMSNNDDFYNSLHNLYNLDEIHRIEIREDRVEFCYSKPPYGYSVTLIYGEDVDSRMADEILENWWLDYWAHI